MPAAGTTAAPAAGTTAAPAAGLLSFYLLTYTLVTAISQLPNKFIIIIIIITDISKRTINDKLSSLMIQNLIAMIDKINKPCNRQWL